MQVVENLTSVERELLHEHLLKLRHALDPGFAYLNWTSLGILDFVAAAVKVWGFLALQAFSSLHVAEPRWHFKLPAATE